MMRQIAGPTPAGSKGDAEPLASLGETERLLLRAPQEEDFETLVALWTDPDVTRHI
jgi:RimJ/RimL family protein N-acetyltransferase